MTAGAYVVQAACLAVGGVSAWGRAEVIRLIAALGFLLLTVVLVRVFVKRIHQGKPKLRKLEPAVLTADQLPRVVSRGFAKYDPKIESLGFSHIGDYRMHSDVKSSFDRMYYAPDSDVWATVAVATIDLRLFHYPMFTSLIFSTVFADGTHLCTFDMHAPEESQYRPPQIVYRSRAGLLPDQLYDAHCRCVDEYADENGTYALVYPAEQLVDVSVYYMQYQRDYWLSRDMVEPPPGYIAQPAPAPEPVTVEL